MAAALMVAACRDPTQVTLEISTDVPCADLTSTSITTGVLTRLEGRDPSAETQRCDAATGRIGSLVLVPSAGDSAEVAVRVIAGIGRSPDECVANGYVGGCIVARRALRYIPNRPLLVPVEMSSLCRDVPCDEDETCVRGACVSAQIPDPRDCARPRGCTPLAPDAGPPPPDATADASPDAPPESGSGGFAGDTGASGAGGFGGGTLDASAGSGGSAGRDAGADATDAALEASVPPGTVVVAGSGDDRIQAIARDDAANLYVVGTFDGSLSLGGALLTSKGGRDVFVASFDASGAHRWSTSFGGTGNESPWGIAVGASGAPVVTGGFASATMDVGTDTLNGLGGSDVFLAAFDAFGAATWARSFGAAFLDEGRGVGLDPSGNVVMVGSFRGTVSFGGASLVANGTDAFVAGFSPLGAHRWSRSMGASGADIANAVAVDSLGLSYVTGSFEGDVDFGSATPLASAGQSDVFIASYGSIGAHLWSQRYGSAGIDEGAAIAATTSRIAVVGSYGGSTSFGGSVLTHRGNGDAFLASYLLGGAHVWSVGLGGSDVDVGTGVALHDTGAAFAVGYFHGSATFGGPSLVAEGRDAFATAFTASGGHQWSRRVGGPGIDEAGGVAATGATTAWLGARVQAGVDLGTGPLPVVGAFDGVMVPVGP